MASLHANKPPFLFGKRAQPHTTTTTTTTKKKEIVDKLGGGHLSISIHQVDHDNIVSNPNTHPKTNMLVKDGFLVFS